MDSIFKVCKNGVCGITITGLEKDNDEYLNEDSDIAISTRNYAYSHTITINVLTGIKSNGEETIYSSDVVIHNIDCIDESDMTMPIDGLYEITHIILPTTEWLAYVIDRDKSALDAYESIYIYDLENKTFKKYINNSLIDASLEEILQVNAIPPEDIQDKTTTIIRSDKNTFNMCYINECFANICKKLLGIVPSLCENKLDNYKLDIYNRDIIWMAINVMKYLIELKQLYEAQRILENIIQCGNICSNNTSLSKPLSGCGCNN